MTRNIAESCVASSMVNKGLKLTKISVFGSFNRHTATNFVALSSKSLIILQLPLIIKYKNKISHHKFGCSSKMVNVLTTLRPHLRFYGIGTIAKSFGTWMVSSA